MISLVTYDTLVERQKQLLRATLNQAAATLIRRRRKLFGAGTGMETKKAAELPGQPYGLQ